MAALADLTKFRGSVIGNVHSRCRGETFSRKTITRDFLPASERLGGFEFPRSARSR